jgi:catechol 2,3-dioxygenase-like lactoylglutathione lyase family enzyme
MITGGMPNIYVSDLDRAVNFYTGVLGLKLLFRAGPHIAQIDAGGGLVLSLHPTGPKSPEAGRHGSISIGFGVNGKMEDEVAALTAKGVTFRGPIIDDPPVRLAYFGDPDDNDLYLCEFSGKP